VTVFPTEAQCESEDLSPAHLSRAVREWSRPFQGEGLFWWDDRPEVSRRACDSW
jgi:hypothetical protein